MHMPARCQPSAANTKSFGAVLRAEAEKVAEPGLASRALSSRPRPRPPPPPLAGFGGREEAEAAREEKPAVLACAVHELDLPHHVARAAHWFAYRRRGDPSADRLASTITAAASFLSSLTSREDVAALVCQPMVADSLVSIVWDAVQQAQARK